MSTGFMSLAVSSIQQVPPFGFMTSIAAGISLNQDVFDEFYRYVGPDPNPALAAQFSWIKRSGSLKHTMIGFEAKRFRIINTPRYILDIIDPENEREIDSLCVLFE